MHSAALRDFYPLDRSPFRVMQVFSDAVWLYLHVVAVVCPRTEGSELTQKGCQAMTRLGSDFCCGEMWMNTVKSDCRYNANVWCKESITI